MRRKTSRSSTKRRSRHGSSGSILAVLLVLAALCAGAWWYLQGNTEQQADEKITHLETVQDDGDNADYRKASSELQDAVETWLKAEGATVTVVHTEDREEQRRSTGGTIFWTTKELEVVPDKEISKEALEKELDKSGGQAMLYQSEETSADGHTVTEYDIALFDMLDGEQLYLVVAKLYVTEPNASRETVAAVKKEVEKKAEKQAEQKNGKKTAGGYTEPANVKGRLAVVIDDCGSSLDTLQEFNNIPVPLTYAVMPYKAYTAACADSGYQAGRQIIVHMPMQPQGTVSSESVYISTDMSDSKARATAEEILDQVPHASGMNNHQGSLATSDSRIMKAVMQVMKNRGLEYLDSRTSSSSVGEQTARAMGVPASRNNLFLDNDASVSAVESRLRQAARIARENGSAVVIGHCRSNTARALDNVAAELRESGIELVTVSSLME